MTAIIASQLSGRARRRELDAEARQRELERLYALSRALLLLNRGTSIPGAIARQIADIFELVSVGMYDQRTDRVSWAGPTEWPELDSKLREVARQPAVVRDPSGLILIAIQLGGAPIGSIALRDVGMTDTVLRSIANLAAIGLERARADEATARAEAARESSELRAAVLDALAHEFKTPLTAMKVASSDLRASGRGSPREAELTEIIDEELDRLNMLVTDAIQMLRIDAQDFTIHVERQSVAGVVAAARQPLERRFEGHDLVQQVPPDLMVDADPALLALALRLLLDNALKYSPAASAIEIAAGGNGRVDISVRNTGSVIPEAERPRIFDRFYRSVQARRIPGSGMGLTIVAEIARAHGGSVGVTSSHDAGTTLTISLPRKESQS